MNNLLFYRWETGTFGPCSSSCGGGERVRPVRCVQKYRVNVVKVPDSECLPDSAPNAVEKCNPQFCPARYKILFINLYFFKSPLHGLTSFPAAIFGEKGFMWKPTSVCWQMACVRARGMFSSVRSRRGQTRCIMCPTRGGSGCWSGSKLLFKSNKTTWFCALCGRRLSHWMGVEGRGKRKNGKRLKSYFKMWSTSKCCFS